MELVVYLLKNVLHLMEVCKAMELCQEYSVVGANDGSPDKYDSFRAVLAPSEV